MSRLTGIDAILKTIFSRRLAGMATMIGMLPKARSAIDAQSNTGRSNEVPCARMAYAVGMTSGVTDAAADNKT